MYKVFSIRYLQFIKYFPKVWIFGMAERETNTLLIYPVPDRSEDTLLPIIQRHVEPGSTIYIDGWSAYCGLNDLGYHYFTVLHKYSFKKVYIRRILERKLRSILIALKGLETRQKAFS